MIDRRYNVNLGNPIVEPNVNDPFHSTRLLQVVGEKIDICGLFHRLITTGVTGNK
jgi:hypothetical protein